MTVDLVPGGGSRVTVASDGPLPEDAVSAALDEAGGYQITAADTRRLELRGQPAERRAEAAGTRLLDEHQQLVLAHLHPLAEIIGDDDPLLRRRPGRPALPGTRNCSCRTAGRAW